MINIILNCFLSISLFISGGQKKILVEYKGEGSDEIVVERITYSESGDILIFEKPLNKIKMVMEYYENGQIQEEGNWKDGELIE